MMPIQTHFPTTMPRVLVQGEEQTQTLIPLNAPTRTARTISSTTRQTMNQSLPNSSLSKNPPKASTDKASNAPSDEQLFQEVRERGSESAFNALYKRYDKRLYAYCLRATASHDAAKDAFQAVMTIVFEKREQFTGGSYAAWLFTIARHHVMKVSKRQQRDLVQNKEIDEEFDALTPSDDGNAHEARDFLLQESLDRAIAQLPEDLREAFELKFYDGLQHEEIAELLKISLSLAKVRVFRAKQQLRELLTPIFKELQ